MPRKTIDYHKRALANYEEWLATDPDNAKLIERKQYHEGEIRRIAEYNRHRHELRKKNKSPRDFTPEIDRLRQKINKKERTLDYYRGMRETNPLYFDGVIASAQFDLQVLRSRLRAVLDQQAAQ